jgi:hypothetical protein
MRLLQGAAIRLEDQVLDALFSQFANKSGSNSPVTASAVTSGGAASNSLPDVKTGFLRAMEALPAPNVVSDDNPDFMFATLDDRQALLNLFRW